MAKHLSELDIKNILKIINLWNPDKKLTWNYLCNEVATIIGKKPTRQSLSSHRIIAETFNSQKTKNKARDVNIVRPANLKIASQRIQSLNAEIKSLTDINRAYKEKFLLWQYNAHCRGLSEEDLEKPLPKIYR